MPEKLQTTAYEDRASGKLGVTDYLKNVVVNVMLPFVGFGVGLALRKVVKSPVLAQPPGISNYFVGKEMRAELIATADAVGHYTPRNAEMTGLMAGGFYGTYNLWRNRSKAELDTNATREVIDHLKPMESANTYLERENNRLRQRLNFDDKPALTHVEQLAKEDRGLTGGQVR